MIDQFVIKDPITWGFPGRCLDHARIAELSEEDFAAVHLELMTEYRDKDGWWTPGKMPSCGLCHQAIDGPETLRRYHGRTLDPQCFKKVWAEERADFDGNYMQAYWDRVANLVITPSVKPR